MTKPVTINEVREAFLKYFEFQGHARVASSSLIPSNDPTLLFTAAGMVQFKDCFLGLDKRAYTRATTAQKCVRAGGKHNDLENVGFTSRHHTFFEMLGNFSFGDYFKEEAIRFAWEFSTVTLGLPKEKLRVSVHISDDESARIWEKITGWKEEPGSHEGKGRIVRFDADNFWSAGDTGPCGPCTEIFYDQGADIDGDRWLEYWNCVFMQYDRDASGKLTPLPKPSVDTGMGLERITSILQGLEGRNPSGEKRWISNYGIDIFDKLVGATAQLVKERVGRDVPYNDPIVVGTGREIPWDVAALRVIVDHLRSTSFLIADGVLPSNEGRGYVLRRILRRAVRFGKRLGLEKPFLADLYPVLVDTMGATYPELKSRAGVVTEILTQEETRFFETLDRGLKLLDEAFEKARAAKSQKLLTLPADLCFRLYDTFGFPLDLTALIAREHGLAVDEAGFDKLMSEQQERSRKSWKGSGETAMPAVVKEWKSQGVLPKFVGYDAEEAKARVAAVAPLPAAKDDFAWVSVDPNPFYAESGGQVGDEGWILTPAGEKLEVLDTQKPYEGGAALLVRGGARLKTGDTVTAKVDGARRAATKANHTATHLLHAALRKFLGTHVQQAGSLVEPDKLRFDFSHPKAVTADEIEKIETWVNAAIDRDISLQSGEYAYDEAIKRGAMALFSEKYGDKVRVIELPELSVELCGGTHVKNTGEIRYFKITSESAVAAGTRRIEAVTRTGALDYYRSKAKLLERVSQALRTPPEQLEDRVAKLAEQTKTLEREVEKLRRQLISGGSGSQSQEASYKGMPLKIHVLDGADAKLLREQGDQVRKAEPTAVHVVVSGTLVLVTVDTDKLPKAHAGNILKELATGLGGRGGGQAQTAQGQLTEAAAAGERIAKWAQAQA